MKCGGVKFLGKANKSLNGCFLYIIIIPFLLQRPLKTIAIKSGDVYIPRGVAVPALDKDYLWEFEPRKLCKIETLSYLQ